MSLIFSPISRILQDNYRRAYSPSYYLLCSSSWSFCALYSPAIGRQQFFLLASAQYLHNYTQKPKQLQLFTIRNFYIIFQLSLSVPYSGKSEVYSTKLCITTYSMSGNVTVHSVLSNVAKIHSRLPAAMEFWLVCLGILAYSCQNTSRDSGV